MFLKHNNKIKEIQLKKIIIVLKTKIITIANLNLFLKIIKFQIE